MILILTVIVALLVHLALGWPWVIAAGIVAGYLRRERGWMFGAAGVGLAWIGLVLYGFVVSSGPTGEMLRVTGRLLGNVTGIGIVVLTVLMGCLLGGLGGGIGTQIAFLASRRETA